MHRRLALLTLLAALGAALAPGTAAAAKKTRRPRPPAAAKQLYEVSAVDLRGYYASAGYSGGADYRYRGELRYETTVDEHGRLDLTPKRGRVFTGVIDPIEYEGHSEMVVNGETDHWQCGGEMPRALAPTRLAGTFHFDGRRWSIAWLLTPPAWSCPPGQGAPRPVLPGIPTRLARAQIPLAKLQRVKVGKRLVVRVDVEEEWSEGEADQLLTLEGRVELLRVR